MKTLIVLSFLLMSTAQAMTCDVWSQTDARTCIKRIAKGISVGHEANDAFVSNRKDLLISIIKQVNPSNEKALRLAGTADYVGAVLVHTDEHTIKYFAMKKADATKPTELLTLNFRQLSDMSFNADSVLARPFSWFLDDKSSHETDVFRDLYFLIEEAVRR